MEQDEDTPWEWGVKLENIDDYEVEVPLAAFDINKIEKESDSSLSTPEKTVKPGNTKCTMCDEEVTAKCYRHHLGTVHGLTSQKADRNDENGNECDEKCENSVEKSIGDKDPFVVTICKNVSSEGSSGTGDKSGTLCLPGVECQICNQVYSNDVNLRKHMYNVHKMVRVKCSLCDKIVNKKSLYRHMKNVHSIKGNVKREKKLTSLEEKFPCALCGKNCFSSSSLLNHVKTTHEGGQYKCGQCEFQGSRKILDKHVRKEHNNEIYQCGHCQKILKSKSALKEHMWMHTEHRRFICYICGMRFKRTSNYRGHMKSHQEKKFQCRICGNFFLRKRYLAIHEQTIHNYYGEGVPPKEKGYQCEICGVKLRWKNNLLAHMRIHTGEKPYKCKICKGQFTCRGSLRTHMAKHSACLINQYESNTLIQQTCLGTTGEPSELDDQEC